MINGERRPHSDRADDPIVVIVFRRPTMSGRDEECPRDAIIYPWPVLSSLIIQNNIPAE